VRRIMNQIKKSYLQLFLLLCFAISLTTIFPTTALSHQPIIADQITFLDDCSADTIRPAIPQSEGAYVANSNTGKFHYAGSRYVGMMSNNHKVYFDSREEAAEAGYAACKVCRPSIDNIVK